MTSTAARAGSKSELTRERILDATAEMLNRNGYAGTRLADIAELAGVQAPAIYYYFGSRDEVISEAVQVGVRRLLAAVDAELAALPADASPLERILVAVATHLRMALRDPTYAAAAIRNSALLPPALREAQLVDQRRYGDVWRRLLQEAADAGELNPALDVRAARMLVIGALNWAPEWWNPARGSLTRTIETAQLMIRQALAPPETGDVS